MSFDPNSSVEDLLVKQIEDLSARANKLRDEASELDKLRDESILEFIRVHYGVSAGMTVLADGARRMFDEGEEVLVVEVLLNSGCSVNIAGTRSLRRRKPWLNVRKKRKDGSWSGKVVCLLDDWKLKPQIAE